ncbi:Plug domain-containing protein [Paracoccus sp. (in: a-proteobacteria)]|uniref:Plug domain-containing protein n=1 Tax=Paracoccus sp. TaxID=267 RepID=UPI002AFFAC70|nr:Plug domain-containing protein [Paracoccus sp. (in: a-proteobacteria)]
MTLDRQRPAPRSLTLAALLLSVSALPLHAQEEPELIMLRTIYITGAKRVQDQLSFPGSVAQVSGEEVVSAGVTGVDGIDRLFPGVAVDARSSRAYANFTVRGQASLDFYNPSVQLYVDGLPQDAATLGQMFPVGLETVVTFASGSVRWTAVSGALLASSTLQAARRAARCPLARKP